jgi:hypothetical protein
MSSSAKTTEPRRGQQTLYEAVNSRRILEPIRGVHPRVELPNEECEEWLRNNHEVSHVVINFSDAEKIIERDGDLSIVLEPWHTKVIVGTENDETVDERGYQDILDLLNVVQPAIYVPDMGRNYRPMSEEEQDNAVEAYLYHVETLQKKILEPDLSIRLIPTNKGWKYEHFQKYQELYDQFGYTEFAFYCVQYTGGDAGNSSRQLRRHTTNAISALGLEDVFAIGRLAFDDLLRFDPRVRGATGLRQWKSWCETEKGLSQLAYPPWKERHERGLSLNNDLEQSYMTDFSESTNQN